MPQRTGRGWRAGAASSGRLRSQMTRRRCCCCSAARRRRGSTLQLRSKPTRSDSWAAASPLETDEWVKGQRRIRWGGAAERPVFRTFDFVVDIVEILDGDVHPTPLCLRNRATRTLAEVPGHARKSRAHECARILAERASFTESIKLSG